MHARSSVLSEPRNLYGITELAARRGAVCGMVLTLILESDLGQGEAVLECGL